MVLFTGPLYSGKHEAARAYAEATGKPWADIRVCEVQGMADAPDNLQATADELAANDIVLYTEVGSGLVPVDEEERQARETAGRLSILLAERADEVYRVFCGIAKKLK